MSVLPAEVSFFSFFCGLRHVQCLYLRAHFTAPVFAQFLCGSSCTRLQRFTVVHGVLQRQRQTPFPEWTP